MHGVTTIFTLVTIVNLLVLFVASAPLTANAQGLVRSQTNSALHVNATVGSQVVLPCHSLSITETNADWSKDVSDTTELKYHLITSDGEVQHGYAERFRFKRSEDGWHNLTISNVQLQDAGLYKCHKDGGIGEAIYVQLNIQGRPDVGQSPFCPSAGTGKDTMYKSVKAGNRISFSCLVGTRRVLWRHYDETLFVRNISIDGLILRKFIDIFSIERSYEENNHLVINNATQSNTGRYECVTDNGLGESHSVVLFVIGEEPQVVHKPESNHPSKNYLVSTGTSGVGVTNGLVLAVLITIFVFGVLVIIAYRKRNRRPIIGNEDQELDPLLHNDLEVNYVHASTGYHLRHLHTFNVSDRILICYFSELNGIYCMVDMSGTFILYEQKLNEDGQDTFEKLCESPPVEPCTPSGFTVSRTNECFYIGNHVKRSVYCCKLNDAQNEVHWRGFIPSMEADNKYPKSLTSLPDGRLAVLVAIEQPFVSGKWLGKIEIHQANGTCHMTIDLPKHVVYPWCAVYTGIDKMGVNDTFALTYGLSESGVIRLDSDGTTLAECKKGLSIIRGIKYNKANKLIYFADVTKCRMLQMNLQLEEPSVVHDWRGPAGEVNDNIQPVRLNLNADASYLSVGFESGRVSLYRFQQPNATVSHQAAK